MNSPRFRGSGLISTTGFILLWNTNFCNGLGFRVYIAGLRVYHGFGYSHFGIL